MCPGLHQGEIITDFYVEDVITQFHNVCLSGTSLSKALNIHISLLGLGAVSGLFKLSHSALLLYFVGQTEPKILSLVGIVILNRRELQLSTN